MDDLKENLTNVLKTEIQRGSNIDETRSVLNGQVLEYCGYKIENRKLVDTKYESDPNKRGRHNIKNIISKFKTIFLFIKNNFITIRPAGNMMSITEAMKRSVKLKTLKEFAEWVYKNWAQWDKEFNWDYLNTWCYDEKRDKRIGWRKTYIITISYPSNNNSHPIAFTDKPFYKLKSNDSDNIEIAQKYPKLLECVEEMRTGTRDESKLYRKHMIDIWNEEEA